ncbi:hypothetical protein [Janthinobacterium sp. LB3P118]|uniref:hypothetical protein n=1 Tax=Janthinobacterium sp. LB3P118 TaxID=3424195 RepID=UPI003F27B53F
MAALRPPTFPARPARDAIAGASAAYRRSTQNLLRGHVPLYQPSAALKAWLLKQR